MQNIDLVDIYTWLNELEDDEFSNMGDSDRVPPEETPLHISVPLGAHNRQRHRQLKVYIRETFIWIYSYNTARDREDSSGDDTYPSFGF